ncbi:hypothetical protein [Saccharomonospora iraqiensis]|uniref:hypothetical protein n=1 Tax=Saccharomonospora iraqiensis TaxID=52698 RepID=UPI00022DF0CB|nr:hypothetical protein [Saccharomonospora iraqiensis]
MRPFGGRFALAVLGATTGVLVAGCGEPAGAPSPSSTEPSVPGSAAPRPGPVSGSTVNWVNDYCGAVTEVVQAVSDMPTIDPSTTRSIERTSSEMLRAVVGGLDRALDRLESLDPAPSEGAEQVRARAVTTYTGIRDEAVSARSELDAADGVRASRDALSRVNAPMDEIGELDLLEGFDSVPRLGRAGAHAPACRDLTEGGPEPRIDVPDTAGNTDGGR